MRNYWMGLGALPIVFFMNTLAFSQDEFPPTVTELYVSSLIDQVTPTGSPPTKEIQFEDCITPFFKTYTILENIDSVILEVLDLVAEPDKELDMPDTKTPYRTHGGVI